MTDEIETAAKEHADEQEHEHGPGCGHDQGTEASIAKVPRSRTGLWIIGISIVVAIGAVWMKNLGS